jgi:hypothetical protein
MGSTYVPSVILRRSNATTLVANVANVTTQYVAELASATSNVVLVDGAGRLTLSNVAQARLAHLGDVTAPIQAQLGALDSKIDEQGLALRDAVTANNVLVGNALVLSAQTASRALVLDATGNVASSAVTAAELAHLGGVTSPVQAQLGALGVRIDGQTANLAHSLASNVLVASHVLVLAAQTASRALVLDATGNVVSSAVTAAELGHLGGVASPVQAQLDGKQATVVGAASTVAAANLAASRVVVSDAGGKLAASALTTTQLGYLADVTSGIQAQLGGKQDAITGAASTVTASNLGSTVVVVTDVNGKLASSAMSTVTLSYLDATGPLQAQLNAKANIGDNAAFKELTVSGNLAVTGTTTFINTEQTVVQDPVVVLNSGRIDQPTGFYLLQGGTANVALVYQNGGLEVFTTGTAANAASYAVGAYQRLRVGDIAAGAASLAGRLTVVPAAAANGYMCSMAESYSAVNSVHSIAVSTIDAADAGAGIFAGQLMIFVTNGATDGTNKTGYASVSLLKSPPDFDVVPISIHRNVNLAQFDVGRSNGGDAVIVVTDPGCRVSWKFDGNTIR